MPYVKAIGTLSSYMMFLLAFRPDMLPGLALRSLYKLTCQDLFRLSSDYRNRSRRCRSRPRRSLWDIIILGLLKRLLRWHGHPCSSRLSQGEETLASILCGDYSIVDAALEDEGEPNANGVPSSAKTANQQHLMNTGSIKSYIPLGSKLADELLRMEETETPGLDFLQAIFNVWVEMLLCSSYRRVPCQTPQQWGRAHNRRVADCGTRWPVPHRHRQQGSSFDQAAARTYYYYGVTTAHTNTR